MADIKIQGETYKLRAGSAMPVAVGKFILQTFGAERSTVDTYLYTNFLKSSDEFRGQNGPYISANFTRLLDKGGDSFSGNVVHNPEFTDETNIQ